MTESYKPYQQTIPDDSHNNNDDMPGFYQRWRKRAHKWISKNTREEVADAVLFLPDLLALVLRLIGDPRTPMFFKGQLLLVAAYVIVPIDFIPEAVFGAAGLADDALIVSAMLSRLLQHATELDPALLRDNWSGSGDVVETIEDIIDGGGELMNTKLWHRVRSMLGISAPDPAVVDGQISDHQN